MSNIKAITGGEAVAEAMKQINPDVVAAYPITPQTIIMQKFADFHADGLVDSEMVRVESEHSAMSCVIGSSAAGARSMTATASAGLALMWEVVGIAAGLRLPMVMAVANRALSAPINIHCDHSDAMGARDLGWIMLFSENGQEAYENMFLATRLGEHKGIFLPVMVNLDGFITSHGVENIKTYDDETIKKFVGERVANKPLLDTNTPVTYGPLQLQDYYFETRFQQIPAMEKVKKAYLEIGKELSKITGNKYDYFEKYQMDDAEAVIVTMNSTSGTTKTVIDRLRKGGKKVGLLKIRLFRPFPYEEVMEALKDIKTIAVLDRAASFGSHAPLYSEIRNSLYDLKKRPNLHSCVFGLGGRNIYETDIEDVFTKLLNEDLEEISYIGLRK
ncbi:MAG: pyruvate ferredoxin oxidoreductase [Candidatus Woesearchaeota archaeon]|jgi:pyruvate ferredoxin oxidoreductase alpha subunit|nr:pyruvate ferredoxin oxidoreductase [Candidatus Woesearchaeota archaeon]